MYGNYWYFRSLPLRNHCSWSRNRNRERRKNRLAYIDKFRKLQSKPPLLDNTFQPTIPMHQDPLTVYQSIRKNNYYLYPEVFRNLDKLLPMKYKIAYSHSQFHNDYIRKSYNIP